MHLLTVTQPRSCLWSNVKSIATFLLCDTLTVLLTEAYNNDIRTHVAYEVDMSLNKSTVGD
jgi:hypothetical protein